LAGVEVWITGLNASLEAEGTFSSVGRDDGAVIANPVVQSQP
jgi:hypothetical protein